MDQITVNIGDGTAYNDDEVVLIGAQGDECISIEKWQIGWRRFLMRFSPASIRVCRAYIEIE
jgi:hypothetical protein